MLILSNTKTRKETNNNNNNNSEGISEFFFFKFWVGIGGVYLRGKQNLGGMTRLPSSKIIEFKYLLCI
jgi:hypothetical protein